MPERSYRVVLWSLALVGLLADQATKYGVFGWLRGVDSRCFALFQDKPEKRYFATVPGDPDPDQVLERRGFFLEVSFENRDGELVPSVNHGALFGLWREHETMANYGFAGISLLAAAAIVVWSMQKNTAKDRWLCISLGLILAGTLGNFYDRLFFNGVRDFLHWNYLYKEYSGWPVFNIADCCLVIGAGLLLVQAFFSPAHKGDKKTAEADKNSVAEPVGSGS